MVIWPRVWCGDFSLLELLAPNKRFHHQSRPEMVIKILCGNDHDKNTSSQLSGREVLQFRPLIPAFSNSSTLGFRG